MQLKSKLFLLAILMYWNFGFSQNSNTRFDYEVKEATLSEALYKLSKLTGKTISFSSDFFKKEDKISLKLNRATTKIVLNELFKGRRLSWKKVNDGIVIIPVALKKYTLSGYIKDEVNGERLPTATLYEPSTQRGVSANEYGFFSMELEEGQHTLEIAFLGYSTRKMTLNIQENKLLQIALKTDATLAEVVIYPEEQAPLARTAPNAAYELSQDFINDQPSVGGEEDLVRAVQLLPGVQSGIDGFGGLQVRGGNAGQNLMLMDGVPIYIPYHLLGMYSVYNTSTVQSAKLLKGAIPARYGGVTSAVFDVRVKEGNSNNWSSEVAANLTLGKAIIEGPLFNGKGALMISGRYAHSDILMKPVVERLYFEDAEGRSNHGFWDLNAKFNYSFSEKDRIYLSYFRGSDFLVKNDSLDIEDDYANSLEMTWQNRIFAFRWNHLHNERMFSNLTATYSISSAQYARLDEFSVLGDVDNDGIPDEDDDDYEEEDDETYFLADFLFLNNQTLVRDLGLKWDFDFIRNPQHNMRFGLGASLKDIVSELSYIEEDFLEIEGEEIEDIEDLQALTSDNGEAVFEGFVYAESNHRLTNQIQLNLGLRASSFAVEEQVYFGLEPRIYLQYDPSEKWRFHASSGRMLQYLHLVNSSTLSMPSDLWVSSNEDIKPQIAWEHEIGVSFNPMPNLNFSVQAYQKQLENQLSYPENFNFLYDLNEVDFEDAFVSGQLLVRGIESLVKYHSKRHSLLFSYTLSKTENTYEALNDGFSFPNSYDHRHQFKTGLSYQVSKYFSFSVNAVYLTANPIIELAYADSDNGFSNTILNPQSIKDDQRLAPYTRVDLGLKYDVKKSKIRHQVKLGLYNAFNRLNTAYYRYDADSTDGTLFAVNAMGTTPSFSYKIIF